MTKQRSRLEKAAGKLISAIQKEWNDEIGEDIATDTDDVMDRGHDLLQASKNNSLAKILNGKTIAQYLGEEWLQNHPSVEPFVKRVEAEFDDNL